MGKGKVPEPRKEVRQFQCDICKKYFMTLAQLEAHANKEHPR